VSASNDKSNNRGPSPSAIDRIEKRWVVGTPAVPDVGRRTLTAIVCLLVLFAVLYLVAT
jgi:hypothetical protein